MSRRLSASIRQVPVKDQIELGLKGKRAVSRMLGVVVLLHRREDGTLDKKRVSWYVRVEVIGMRRLEPPFICSNHSSVRSLCSVIFSFHRTSLIGGWPLLLGIVACSTRCQCACVVA
jgi:hypothetical protein